MAKQKHWDHIEYILPNSTILSNILLEKYLNNFWKEIMEPLPKNHFILLVPKIKFENNQIISLSSMQTIDTLSKDLLLTFLKDRIALGNEDYKIKSVYSIIFSYGIRKGKKKLSLASQLPPK